MKKQDFFYEFHHDKNNRLASADCVNETDTSKKSASPHFHRALELIYVREGSVEYTIENQTSVANVGDIIFIAPCKIHSYTMTPHSSYIAFIIGEKIWEDFHGVFQKGYFSPLLSDKDFNGETLPFWETLLAEKSPSDLVRKGYINIILGKLLEHYPTKPTPPTPQMDAIVAALNYIDEHFTEEITLDSISTALGYNKYYFSRLFNRYIGEKLTNYINMVRLRRIVHQAKKTPKTSLMEIAFKNGFDSMTTFYRVFRDFYDCSPSEMLKRSK